MKIKKILVLGALLSVFVVQVYADSVDPKTVYKNTASVDLPVLKVPTVVELCSKQFGSQVAVFDDTTSAFVPSLLRSNVKAVLPESISSSAISPELGARFDASDFKKIHDYNYTTFTEFPVDENGTGSIILNFKYSKPVTVNSFVLSLSEFVALPNRVSLFAKLGDVYKPMLIDVVPQSSTIDLPGYTSDTFEVHLIYSQPLRINEVSFGVVGSSIATESLRFLALPDHSYKIFSNPVYAVSLNLGESGDLQDNRDVLVLPQVFSSSENLLFKEPDVDNDDVVDAKDNCVQTANPDQKDEDANGRGDACDDFDRDGIINSIDNCVAEPNRTQTDTDKDGKGDVCDGEESRFTEKYPALVWGAIGFAVLVFGSLFYFVLRKNQSSSM